MSWMITFEGNCVILIFGLILIMLVMDGLQCLALIYIRNFMIMQHVYSQMIEKPNPFFVFWNHIMWVERSCRNWSVRCVFGFRCVFVFVPISDNILAFCLIWSTPAVNQTSPCIIHNSIKCAGGERLVLGVSINVIWGVYWFSILHNALLNAMVLSLRRCCDKLWEHKPRALDLFLN